MKIFNLDLIAEFSRALQFKGKVLINLIGKTSIQPSN